MANGIVRRGSRRINCADWLMNLMGTAFWRSEFNVSETLQAKEKLDRILRLARLYRRSK